MSSRLECTSTLKRGRGGLAIDKKDYFFFQLWKDADRKCWFCLNVSTLLSMIVASNKNPGLEIRMPNFLKKGSCLKLQRGELKSRVS